MLQLQRVERQLRWCFHSFSSQSLSQCSEWTVFLLYYGCCCVASWTQNLRDCGSYL